MKTHGIGDELTCPKCLSCCLYANNPRVIGDRDDPHAYGLHSEWGGFVYGVWCSDCDETFDLAIDPRHGNIRMHWVIGRVAKSAHDAERLYTLDQLRGAWGAGFHKGKEERST